MIQNTTKSRKIFLWALALVFPVLLCACGSPSVDWELSISGDVRNPTTYTYDELSQMPQTELGEILMEKSTGPDEVHSFSGVNILTLLESAGAPENFSTITAKAADGYAIEISRDEMVDGIVAMKQGGEWIIDVDPDAGPIRLVFPSTPANRWVFQVNEIVVNQ